MNKKHRKLAAGILAVLLIVSFLSGHMLLYAETGISDKPSLGSFTWHKKDLLTESEQNKIMKQCAALKGKPYKLGTRGPSSFDCTGFVWYVMRNCGISDLKSAMNEGVWVTAKWYQKFHGKACDQGTNIAKASTGDVIIYGNASGKPQHAAIYAGKEGGKYMVWHAGVSLGVCKVSNTAVTGSSGKGKLKIIGIYRTTEATGKLQIKKKVDFGSKSGFSFKVSCSALGWSKTYKTDSDGVITLSGLPQGYTFKVEEGTKSGYASVKSQSAKIVSGTKKLTFENKHTTGSLKIVKSVGGAELKDKSGFQFRVYRKGTPAYDKTYKTDKNGVIQITGLYAGYSYTVEEKMTEEQAAVYKGPAAQSITIVKDKVTSVQMKNTYRGSGLVIQKTFDGDTIPPEDLSGFSFTVYEKASGYEKTLTTDESGRTDTFKDLKIGVAYTVKENLTEEQKKIYQSIPEKTVTINAEDSGKIVTFHMENHAETGNLELIKTCEGMPENETELSGFLFAFTNLETGITTQASTDAEGRINLDGMQAGTYEVQEILGSEAAQWEPKEEKQIVEVKKNETASFVFTNVWKTGELKIVKTAEDGVVEGIEFTVTGPDGYEKTAVTDAEGVIHISNLKAGMYQIEETVPEQYEPQKAKIIELKADGDNTVSFYNEKKAAGLRIQKADADTGKSVEAAGFEFVIENPDTGEMWTEQTNASGIVTLRDLVPGTYRITETKVPENSGYFLSDEVYEAVIEAGADELTEITVEDRRQKGRIEIQKNGEILTGFEKKTEEDFEIMHPTYTMEGLEGVTFDIIAEEDIYVCGTLSVSKGEVVCTVQTNEDGAASADVELGKYRVRETYTPEGYTNTKEEYAIELSDSGSDQETVTKELTVENAYQKVRLELQKEMEVSDTYGYGKNGEVKQTVFGIFSGQNISAADGTEVKEDTLLGLMKPEENGEAVYEGMFPFGAYYVRELKTAPGYQLDESEYPFTVSVSADGVQTIPVNGGETVRNVLQSVTVSGVKVDEVTGRPLAGGIFGLFDRECEEYSEAQALATVVTDENGVFQFEPVMCGTYYLAELLAPEGYEPLKEPMKIDITEETEEKLVFTMKNQPVRTELILTKRDADSGEVLSGAGFRIYAEDKQSIAAEGKTDEQGRVSFMLAPGEYYYQEYEAPEGYDEDEKLYPVTIDWSESKADAAVEATDESEEKTGEAPDVSEKKVVRIDVENERKMGSLSVYKADADTGELLDGARFRILDEKGNSVREAVTGEGAVYFDKLPYGTYTVEEAEAPKGYQLAKSEKVTVDQAEDIAVYIKDKKEPDSGNVRTAADKRNAGSRKTGAVKTGDSNRILLWVCLFLLSAGGIVATVKRRNR